LLQITFDFFETGIFKQTSWLQIKVALIAKIFLLIAICFFF